MSVLESLDGANPKIGFQAETSFGRVGLRWAKDCWAYSRALGEDVHPEPQKAKLRKVIWIKNTLILVGILINLSLVLFYSSCEANLDQDLPQNAQDNHAKRKFGLAFFGGPGSMTPLVDIARVRKFELENYFILGLAFTQVLWSNQDTFSIETEESAVKHLEYAKSFSFNGAFVLRWLKTPWSSFAGKSRSSFAFGNGLSYASAIPYLETTLPRTSALLYHLFLEITLSLEAQSPWEALFRIQHRSGAFGLFNEVVGGSDFLCLGLRYRF